MPAALAYGADYSARELTLAELADWNRRNPDRPIKSLVRYIGYPDNPKCISHYPGALTRFREAGYLVLLFVQNGWDDFLGGYEGGKAAARRALEDARREGYPEHLPFIFACDRYLSAAGRSLITGGTALGFLRGAAEIVGAHRTWSYGFWDLQDLVLDNPGTVAGHVLCGARSTNRGSLIWQENNEQPVIAGMSTDRLEFYVDLSHFEGGDDVSWDEMIDRTPGEIDKRPQAPAREMLRYANEAAWKSADGVDELKAEFEEFKGAVLGALSDLAASVAGIQPGAPIEDAQLDEALQRTGVLDDFVRTGRPVALTNVNPQNGGQ